MPSLSKEQEKLNAHLRQRGFDFASPEPQLAWHMFKEFLQEPLQGFVTVQIGFECFHVWDLDDVLWLGYVWELNGESGNFLRIECNFYREVPETMRAVTKNFWWSPEQEKTQLEQGAKWDLMTYLAAVEALPEFKMCVALGGWKWHEYDS